MRSPGIGATATWSCAGSCRASTSTPASPHWPPWPPTLGWSPAGATPAAPSSPWNRPPIRRGHRREPRRPDPEVRRLHRRVAGAAARGDVGPAARGARRADGAGARAAAGDGAGEAAEGQRREALAPGRGLFPRQRPRSDVRRLDRARPRDARERLHGGHSRIAPPRARPARAGRTTSTSAPSGPIWSGWKIASPCRWIRAMRWSSTA